MEGFDINPADYAPSQQPRGLSRSRDGNVVRFYYREHKDEAASIKQGRPIYKKEVYIKIFAPGIRDHRDDWVKFENEELRKVGRDKKGYCLKYRQEWEAFLRGEEVAVTGTPLEYWANPMMDVARVAELKSLGVSTVEQIAEASDTALQKFGMGARKLQKQAIAYLDSAKGGAEISKLVADNENLKAEIAYLKEQIAALSDSSEEKPTKKRRGRPKKKIEIESE